MASKVEFTIDRSVSVELQTGLAEIEMEDEHRNVRSLFFSKIENIIINSTSTIVTGEISHDVLLDYLLNPIPGEVVKIKRLS